MRRGPLTRVAQTTLGYIAGLFAPSHSGVGGIVETISWLIGWVFSRTAMTLQLVLLWASQRDSQRAAAVTALTNQTPNLPLLRRLSRHTEASLFASHPPTGLRAEMLERRPEHSAAVRLDEATSARIDAELDAFSEPTRRVLVDGGLAPVRRSRRKAAVVVALVVLGFFAYQLIKPDERVASIVVQVEPGASQADLDAIGPRLEGSPDCLRAARKLSLSSAGRSAFSRVGVAGARRAARPW